MRPLHTPAPPMRDPGNGREFYLPDDYHFLDVPETPVDEAALITAQTLAQWADRFEAYVVGAPSQRRGGALVGSREERRTVISDAVDWLKRTAGLLHRAALDLYDGDLCIADQHDGIPGPLALTRDQFTTLQNEWESHGLPVTLYYPASEQRIVVEPTRLGEGVVLKQQRYSPLRWLRRSEADLANLRPTPEAERVERFKQSCWQCLQAVNLRWAELTEPGRPIDEIALAKLATLRRALIAEITEPPGESDERADFPRRHGARGER